MTSLNTKYSLSPEQQALLPKESDVAFYEEHGWYTSPQVIPEEVIDRAILGAQRFYRGERDGTLPLDEGYCNWTPEQGDIMRNNEFISLQNREIRQLVHFPLISAIAAKLVRTDEIRLLDDQLISKPPQIDNQAENMVGWHSDLAYWASCSSNKIFTAWIPLQDCDESMGPLVVIDKSHKWPGLEDMRFFNDKDMENWENKFRSEGKEIVKVPMTLKKGQISFHHGWAIHGSYPNHSSVDRRVVAIHLQDGENHYRPYFDKQGRKVQMFDEKLCRTLPNGDPDFSDPDIFPVLWSGK